MLEHTIYRDPVEARSRFKRFRAELEQALNETPPPTVTQVSQHLGINLNSLRRACLELYGQLSSRTPDRRRFEVAKTADALKKSDSG
jgi:hypothetical protein